MAHNDDPVDMNSALIMGSSIQVAKFYAIAIQMIDELFEGGYAANHPDLVVSFAKMAWRNYMVVLQHGDMHQAQIAEAMSESEAEAKH
jgi:hypothetical protein